MGQRKTPPANNLRYVTFRSISDTTDNSCILTKVISDDRGNRWGQYRHLQAPNLRTALLDINDNKMFIFFHNSVTMGHFRSCRECYRMDGWIRLIVGFQPLMVISPTASCWCVCTGPVLYYSDLRPVFIVLECYRLLVSVLNRVEMFPRLKIFDDPWICGLPPLSCYLSHSFKARRIVNIDCLCCLYDT